jgi:GTP-binding protein
VSAESGSAGEGRSRHGKDGKEYILDVPLGSVLTNMQTGKKIEVLEEGELVLLLKGGSGGRGNEHYKSSVNRNPQESTKGKKGESADLRIELQIIADVGLVGLPNAGKTSLLNTLTSAKGKVGAYAFTTLEPNLGECFGKIVADIPGLIEGAAEGKGLGDAFLRHIKRTKILFHCISLESADLEKDYRTVRNELAEYDEELPKKEEWIILTKTDSVSAEECDSHMKQFQARSPRVYAVSILHDESIKSLRDAIARLP